MPTFALGTKSVVFVLLFISELQKISNVERPTSNSQLSASALNLGVERWALLKSAARY
jgi:hypothetical protein